MSHDHAADASRLSALPRRAVLICIGVTAVVAALELWLGWWFSLLSVFAEGLHSSADLLDSLVALVLISIAARPPDRDHPFGHGKFDSVGGVVEGLSVFASGAYAAGRATLVLVGVAALEPQPGAWALLGMGAASVTYWLVSRYLFHLAKVTGSPTVLAEATHLSVHIYITAGLLVGVGLAWWAQRAALSWAWAIDPVIALGLGVWLMGLGVQLVRHAGRQLVDYALPPDELRELTNRLAAFGDEFIEVHGVRTRRAGSERHIDIHLVVPGETTVAAGHDLAHRIEAHIAREWPGTRLLVHIEPASDALLDRYHRRGDCGAVIDAPTRGAVDETTHHDHPQAHGGGPPPPGH